MQHNENSSFTKLLPDADTDCQNGSNNLTVLSVSKCTCSWTHDTKQLAAKHELSVVG